MENAFPLPTKYTVTPIDGQKSAATIRIEPLYPGYGTPLGNALRRVLLSSLEGAAITSVKIEGVQHEFATIPAVKEDVVSILLKLKQLRFKLHGDEPVTFGMKVKGEKKVLAKEFKLPSSVELMNPDHHIATLTDKAGTFDLEVTLAKGLGYLPVESREKEKLEIGRIATDAIFTPVRTVNYEVEHVRVGQRTDYDSVILTVMTDGSILPEEALRQATMILADHFAFVLNQGGTSGELASAEATTEEETVEVPSEDEASEETAVSKKKAANTKKEA